MTALYPELAGLSCYTGSLAVYLAGEDVDAAEVLANSIRLAVRVDLPGGALAFSHHGSALNQLPGGCALRYATADPQQAVLRIAGELATHGRVIVVVDNAELPWSPSYGTGPNAPHWLVVDGHEADRWHVLDPFCGLLPAGNQEPFSGWLPTESLVAASAVAQPWTPEQRRRNELAFGFPVPVPESQGVTWLCREKTPHAPAALPGEWLVGYAAVLPFLMEHLERRLAAPALQLDDMWAVAQHHVFRHRWLAGQATTPDENTRHGDAARAWGALPQALRFAVESAVRGRPRPSLLRTTLDNLLALECSRKDP